MKTVILLTGCINPNGMVYTSLNNKEERQKQYEVALHYYLTHTNYPVVFVDNSNTNISMLYTDAIHAGRLEFLTFQGNKNKERGKGFGEAEIIDYAFRHSSLLQGDRLIIVKITGRLIVNNIASIVKSLKSKHDFITCMIHSDFKFADSRIFCATPSFYHEFLSKSDKINDSTGIFFEHILANTIVHSSACYIPFSEEPLITGISGTTGEEYMPKKPSIKHHIRYKHYTLEQAVKINKMSYNKRTSFWSTIVTALNILRYKLLRIIIH